MIKVSILGYGKMGKEIEKIALRSGMEVVARIDNDEEWKQQQEAFLGSDVAIEFSTPNTVIDNMFRCFDANIPVVCGTTGWGQKEQEVIEHCKNSSNALIFGSNFSIGANLFFKINELTAQMMNKQAQYDVLVEETHHTAKKDAPSGTAITTANIIINQLDRKKGWALQDDSNAENINILAHRIGDVTGIHEVHYQSSSDRITLRHEAFNRAIFAEGAVRSALWLPQHRGIYRFNDIFMQI